MSSTNNLTVKSTLSSLIKKVDGLEASLVSELKKNTITILEPTEQAFANVPEPIIKYLSSDEGNKDLELLLKYHIIANNADVAGEMLPPTISINEVLTPPTLKSKAAELVKNNTSSNKKSINKITKRHVNNYMRRRKLNNNLFV